MLFKKKRIARLILVLCLALVGCFDAEPQLSEDEIKTIPAWYTWDSMFGQAELPETEAKLGELKGREVEHLLRRGEYLTHAVAACGSCHLSGVERKETNGSVPLIQVLLGGGRELPNSGLLVPNISSDIENGIGDWKLIDISNAIRSAITPNGEELSSEVHKAYRWMATEDLTAISAYLLTTTPVAASVDTSLNESKRSSSLLFDREVIPGFVPRISKQKRPLAYGRYVGLHLAACGRCHTAEDSDVFSGNEETNAPDIRGSVGLSAWSDLDITYYLSSGKTVLGKEVAPETCHWNFYRNMSDEDKRLISRFLKSL